MSRIIPTSAVCVLLCLSALVCAEGFEAEKSAVVKITSQAEGKRKTGTGFVVKVEPEVVYIVTAYHVVKGDNAPQIEFYTRRNQLAKGEVLKLESEEDRRGLALLAVRGKQNFPTAISALAFGVGTELTAGDDVLAMGFGTGAGDWAVIKASVASRDRLDVKLDGRIEEGNSGGPVMKDGKVVGLVTGVHAGGFGLATPGSAVADALKWWGVEVSTGSPAAAPQPPVRPEAEAAPREPPPAAPPPAALATVNLSGQYGGRSWSTGPGGEAYVCDFISIMTQRGTTVTGEYSNTCGDRGTFVGEVFGNVLRTRVFSTVFGYSCDSSGEIAQMGASLTGQFDCTNGLRGTSSMNRK